MKSLELSQANLKVFQFKQYQYSMHLADSDSLEAPTQRLQHLAVTEDQLRDLPANTQRVVIDHCTSPDWTSALLCLPKKIRQLTLVNCSVTSPQLAPVLELFSFTSLILNGNQLDDSIVGCIVKHQQSLKQLSLDDNCFNSDNAKPLLTLIIGLENLQRLTLPLEGVKRVQSLAPLRSAKKTDMLCRNCPNLALLSSQTGGQTIAADAVQVLVDKCPNLEKFGLYGTRLEVGVLPIIGSGLHRLAYLGVWNCRIDYEQARHIAGLRSLTHLSIGKNPLGNEAVWCLARSLPNLENIGLHESRIGFEACTQVARNLSHLTCLYLSGNPLCDSLALHPIMAHLSQLRQLWLKRTGINAACAVTMSKLMKKLVGVGLDNNLLTLEVKRCLRASLPSTNHLL